MRRRTAVVAAVGRQCVARRRRADQLDQGKHDKQHAGNEHHHPNGGTTREQEIAASTAARSGTCCGARSSNGRPGRGATPVVSQLRRTKPRAEDGPERIPHGGHRRPGQEGARGHDQPTVSSAAKVVRMHRTRMSKAAAAAALGSRGLAFRYAARTRTRANPTAASTRRIRVLPRRRTPVAWRDVGHGLFWRC
jgi:hypothetical protein